MEPQTGLGSKPCPRWSVGGLFIDALRRRDFAAMAECLDPEVRFRGLVPPGPFEVVGPDAVMTLFRTWFEGPDELHLVDATIGEIGLKLYLRWRVTMTSAVEASRYVEQHVFATIDERIVGLDLLCSGFAPSPQTGANPFHLN